VTSTLAYIPSPPQGVWQLGPFPLRAYALCIIVGIIVALVVGDRRWEARGGERGVIYDIALWAVPFGLIGGRLYHVITDWRTYFGEDGAGLLAAFRVWEGGLGIWGAVALGGVGAWIACRRRGIPLPAFGDAIAPGIILAQAIGRLGNYFNQELYGGPTTLPWGLEIFERLDASGQRNDLIGVSTGRVLEVVHPTFLYELLWNLLVFAVLIWADRRFKLGHGRLFALYVAGYCLGRFWIELLRSDMATHLAGIRINSFTSMFVFIGAVVYLMAAPRGREDPASLRAHEDEETEPRAVAPDDFQADAIDSEYREDEDTATEELLKELASGAVVTTGVGAAAKVAGDAEADDAGSDDDEDDDEAEGEQPVEAVAEAEALAEDVESAPSEDIAEAVAFAEAGEAADEAPPAGLGTVEGDDAVAAEEAAEEAHEAAVERAEEADAVAEEVATEAAASEAPAEAPSVKPSRLFGRIFAKASHSAKPEPEPAADSAPAEAGADMAPEKVASEEPVEAVAEAEALAEDVESAPSEDIAEAVAFAEVGEAADEATPAGLGAVEGDDAVAAEEVAEEAHEAAVEQVAEAAAVAEEVASEETAEPDEPDEAADREPLTTAGAVEGDAVEGDDAVAAEAAAEEAHEAAVERAEEAEVVAEEVASEDTAEEDLEAPVERADEAEAVAEEIAVADAAGDFADEAPVDGATEPDPDEQEPTEPGDDAASETGTATYRIITAPEPTQPGRRWWRRRK
jgi:prolipoprotein diacylglyceryl transferase